MSPRFSTFKRLIVISVLFGMVAGCAHLATGRADDSPGRSGYYPCQNMHVKMSNCPLR